MKTDKHLFLSIVFLGGPAAADLRELSNSKELYIQAVVGILECERDFSELAEAVQASSRADGVSS